MVAASCAIGLISLGVWAHHMFTVGMTPAGNAFFATSTMIVGIPTGIKIFNWLGTIWGGKIRFKVPMLFCLGWVFNFFIGGLSGVFLSDVPSDVTTNGSFFSMAHFHYTIMGGLIFTFFAAIYYWLPKMTGIQLNQKLGKIHFWIMFIAFNSTFAPLFAIGFLGQPRRAVTYPSNLQFLNDWASVSAFVLGFSMLIFLANFVWSLAIARHPAEQNPWHSKSLEWQVPTPVPFHDFDQIPVIDSDPYPYGIEAPRAPLPAIAPAGS
jgi:cytochrome c oxidase subunit 1